MDKEEMRKAFEDLYQVDARDPAQADAFEIWSRSWQAAMAHSCDLAWRPIATAPTDGTLVLVNDNESPEGASVVVAKFQRGSEWSGWVYEDDLLNDTCPLGPIPSHWMPLLAPPALSRQGGQNQCDGCMQGAPLRRNFHVDKDGHAFMTCQKDRYTSRHGG